jgi:hypothetical protein
MPNHPQILVGLKLADVIDFLTFLGRLKECAEAGRNPSGRPNTAAIAQYVTNGFSAAFRWPVSFHEFLDTLRDRKPWNGKTEASALNFFGGFYKSIIGAPIETWGGRARSAFIDYLGVHQHIGIETKSPISKIALKMKTYVDASKAMAILDVDEQGFAELQASDHWCVVETVQQSGLTRYRYGSITKLKELLSSDVVGYHSGAVYPGLHD